MIGSIHIDVLCVTTLRENSRGRRGIRTKKKKKEEEGVEERQRRKGKKTERRKTKKKNEKRCVKENRRTMFNDSNIARIRAKP